VFVVGADALGGEFQVLAQDRIEGREGRLQAFAGDLQLGQGGDVEAVEAVGVFHHRRVAARAHLAQDLLHGTQDLLVGDALPGEEAVQT